MRKYWPQLFCLACGVSFFAGLRDWVVDVNCR